MTSVCLIGNSHLAVLKLGWPDIQASFADMELDFYAAAGGSLAVTVSNGRLVRLTMRRESGLPSPAEKAAISNRTIPPVSFAV